MNSQQTKDLATFNDLAGRLRISITPSCQLACQFCHAEGNEDHGAKKYMHIAAFENLLDAFSFFNGKELNITGGEPLLHPNIKNFLSKLDSREYHTTISTNGLLIDRVFDKEKEYSIDQFKISLHSIRSDAAMKTFLGKGWDYSRLRKNIELISNLGYSVILNYTLTSKNIVDLEDVIKESISLNTDLKIIDLGTVDVMPYHVKKNGSSFFEKNYVSPDSVSNIVSKYATFDNVISNKVGNHIQVYTTDSGNSILVKNKDVGKLHTLMCSNCNKIDRCSEGVFALRVNTNGMYIPCILRPEFNVKDALYSQPVSLKNIKEHMLLAISTQIGGQYGR